MNKHILPPKILKFVFIVITIFIQLNLIAQKDEKLEKRKAQITPLPAISYSPETGVTIGLLGDYYFDLAKGDSTVSRSRVRLLATLTTKRQALIEPSWELYSPNDDYRTFGKIRYRIFNDRNYGLSNNASLLVEHYNEQKDGTYETQFLNYLPFDLKRVWLEATFLKKIKPNLYVGPTIDFDNIFDVKIDSLMLIETADQVSTGKIEGRRLGLGFNITYDTRNSRFYATKGFFGQFNSSFYFNEEQNYNFNKLDLRYYTNITKNHIFAARIFAQNIFGAKAEQISIYGLARVGGRDLLRGYFFGTYQQQNSLTFQTEYRLPFTFLENSFLPLLGRLGVVAFFSGGQVYGNNQAFALNNFRLASGAGIRFNINKKETINIRIDYGFGLHPAASYGNKGQRALYFYLSEAF